MAERWNGVHWTVQPTANPSPALPAHHLNGVSCSSVNACVAVGEFGRAIQPTPGGDGWPLQQVSCRRAFCTAVGFHDRFTLAERYS